MYVLVTFRRCAHCARCKHSEYDVLKMIAVAATILNVKDIHTFLLSCASVHFSICICASTLLTRYVSPC